MTNNDQKWSKSISDTFNLNKKGTKQLSYSQNKKKMKSSSGEILNYIKYKYHVLFRFYAGTAIKGIYLVCLSVFWTYDSLIILSTKVCSYNVIKIPNGLIDDMSLITTAL